MIFQWSPALYRTKKNEDYSFFCVIKLHTLIQINKIHQYATVGHSHSKTSSLAKLLCGPHRSIGCRSIGTLTHSAESALRWSIAPTCTAVLPKHALEIHSHSIVFTNECFLWREENHHSPFDIGVKIVNESKTQIHTKKWKDEYNYSQSGPCTRLRRI